ncbi:FecR family protein [Arenibacter sp. ARW7G5Y1]|uniref:FecR family protein n=1 Tax=Arenibacter sp. ARW7G5Y1 TaxID=2135619 RepID=UPI000D7636BB|nr:FecR family protein [Arenibacter sp. ARW7G5Y1]PXX25733.1 FecR family protein [Arenibacter sp. ARW7G5Y1]
MRKLINKYLDDSIDGVEMERLKVWLEKEKNQKKFKAIVENHYQLNLGLQEVDLEKEYSLLLHKIQDNRIAQRRSSTIWYQRAAILIALFGIGYIMYLTLGKSDEPYIDANAITIKQEDGNIQVIKEDGSVVIVDSSGKVVGRQDGGELDYKNVATSNSNNQVEESLVYNELVVPNGKKMKLILSDSTIVHINSGTHFKYPVRFLKNQNRKVFLDGEAFFEVSEDKNNPFIVNTDDINIRVLGTKFDVSSYANDDTVSTVLVEGAVELYQTRGELRDKDKYLLAPGQIASWKKLENDMDIAVVDVNEYTSWINGQIIFKIRPFPEILKVLERHYDVSITNNYRLLDSQQFFAKFDTETIEQVMTYFQSSIPFSYIRVGNKIEINQP